MEQIKKIFTKKIYFLLFIINIFIFFLYGPGKDYINIWQYRIIFLIISILISFCIYILGFISLKFFKINIEGINKYILSFLLGTFIFTSVVFILGKFKLLNNWLALFILLSLNILFYKEWLSIFKDIEKAFLNFKEKNLFLKFILIFSFIILFINLLHCFIPPLDYDVLEYHLGTPAQYLKKGYVHYIPSNVYSNFPQSMEMIAFFSMTICNNALSGGISAKIVLWFYGLLLFLSVYSLSNIWFEEDISISSACLAYLLPATAELLRKYYVEIPLTFIIITSFIVLYSELNLGKIKKFILIGLIFGTSAGIKYSGFFMALPAFIIVFWLSKEEKEKIKKTILIGVGFIIAFSPWLIRNLINTHNPIYPLFNSIIIPNHWTEIMSYRFMNAHSPSNFNLSNILLSIWESFFVNKNISLFHLILIIPSFYVLSKKIKKLLFFIILWILLWIFFTHRIERFLYPIIIMLCIPMGYILNYLVNIESKIKNITLIFSFLCLFYHQIYTTIPETYDFIIGFKNKEQLLEKVYKPYEAENFINQNINDKILFVGEARTFYIEQEVVYSTVFDYNLLEFLFNKHESLLQIANILKEKNINYIYFNWKEVSRLRESYKFIYKKNLIYGYLNLDAKKLDYFLKNYCVKIYPKNTNKNYPFEIYNIK